MLPTLNSSLNAAVKELQNIEMDFLANGIVIDTRRLQAEADKDIVGTASGYTFSKTVTARIFIWRSSSRNLRSTIRS